MSYYCGRVERTEKEEGTQGGRTGEGQGRTRTAQEALRAVVSSLVPGQRVSEE